MGSFPLSRIRPDSPAHGERLLLLYFSAQSSGLEIHTNEYSERTVHWHLSGGISSRFSWPSSSNPNQQPVDRPDRQLGAGLQTNNILEGVFLICIRVF